ncbi:hypothetical protein [Niveispirillum irakense]|uniref:hypothetical protein n=1 Tax=Niveispirillum irakense TaxID=34011 RepID=UPI0004251ACE|nr:hypothetical protein [Niveispirillum irakense]
MIGRFFVSLGMVALLAVGPALAQQPAAKPGAAAPTADKAFKVEGFRSARFGMTEDQIRQAIAKDFKISGDAIQKMEEPTERTTALLINVRDLLPESGPAVVAYMMGYKSKKLFRVNVIWGKDIGSDATPEQIVNAANALRNFLAGQGYKPDSVVMNRPLDNDNVLVFMGTDNQGRLTELVLGLVTEKGEKEGAPPKILGANMRLSYVEKPTEPDIYRIPGGF